MHPLALAASNGVLGHGKDTFEEMEFEGGGEFMLDPT
jgi:hypothetical protein